MKSNTIFKHIFSKYFPVIVILFSILIFFIFSNFNKAHDNQLPNINYKKIISLSPSITRQIIELESENKLVGVTSFHPPLKTKVETVGNLINPNFEKIIRLNPDIVLYSQEDNPTMKSEQLLNMNIQTYKFDRNQNFEAICSNYMVLAKILGKEKQAKSNISNYKKEIAAIIKSNSDKTKTAFFLSSDPLISISKNSFINEIITTAGGDNILSDFERPYPIVSKLYLIKSKPDIIISTDPNSIEFFTKLYSEIKQTPPRIEIISPDNICYYTPYDFFQSLNTLSGLYNENK